MRMDWIVACGVFAVLSVVPVAVSYSQDDARPADAAEPKPAEVSDAIAQTIKQLNEQDNGLTIDAEKSQLDIQATVCLNSGEFLEMFACTRDTREHESILVLDAVPSTVHLGLLLLGLEPGKPLSYDREADPPKLVPAEGPKVDVFVVLKVDGIEREVPANRWIQDSKTEKMMGSNTWLFAGSKFTEFQEKQVYLADLNGSAISLVNFGDDLLTLPNAMTDDNASHGKVWVPRTRAIPKVGTKVVLRLKPQAQEQKQEPEEENPAEQAAPAPAEGTPGAETE